MDRAVQEDGATMTIAGLTMENAWGPSQDQESSSNVLYIAVGYVKDDYKLDGENTLSSEQAAQFTDFEEHVSPLDPNMSSVARYSPVYSTDSGSYGNPVVVTQLVQDQVDPAYVGTLGVSVVGMEHQEMQENATRAQFMQLVSDSNTENATETGLSLIRDEEQEEVLLIHDQNTGISYSVAPEFMVERCLTDEQQLLEALEPEPLLDGDLLALDKSTLKSFSEIVIDSQSLNEQIDQVLNKQSNANAVNPEKNDENLDFFDETSRRSRQLGFEEEGLLNCVQTIVDKPVPTRARATLPESHLVIQRKNNLYSVFAKKVITKATQFGPLEGIYQTLGNIQENEFNLKIQDKEGYTYRLDISDENTSNWMCFVKSARTFEEQNLVVVEQSDHQLYYVSTKTINPKQELLVGYSSSYAKKYNLPLLEPSKEEKMSWNCYECNASFESSKDLQEHLNVHDEDKDENTKPKKRFHIKRKLLLRKNYLKKEPLECTLCTEAIFFPKFTALRRHLSTCHDINETSVYQYFKAINVLSCVDCELSFDSKEELLTHNEAHNEKRLEKYFCALCPEKFATLKQLKLHNAKVHSKKHIRCPACHKIFASQERLRRHMVVHASEESKPYQCNKCSKRFLTQSALQCHERSHATGRKVFECPICREKFLQMVQLKQHTHKHCVDNKFICPHCSKVFLKYTIIRKHIRAFHSEKKHYCNECSKAFPSLDKLRLHLLRHSDHREFLCADCGKQFKRKDKLSLHCRRVHGEEQKNIVQHSEKQEPAQNKKFIPKVLPTDYHRFIYKCHTCLVGFKRRGMLVNHLAKRHPEISPETVPELNLPILRTTRDYYCQYCDKVYKSSSKRKAHILKIHPGAELPMSNRMLTGTVESLPNPTYSQTVGSVTARPQNCQWCHKQYASKAKLLQHQRKEHNDVLNISDSDFYDDRITQKEDQDVDLGFKEIKVTDILDDMVDMEQNRVEDQLYQMLPAVSATDRISENCEYSPDSRLYRLLTTGSNLAPPR